MYYELALISVLIAAGYWGAYFLRHEPTRLYGVMQLGAAGLAGLGLLARHSDEPGALGIAGAIGVGAGACLLIVGPLVRALARRAAGAERFRIASVLLDIADVLAPGSGIAEEKALLGAMREIRDGNIEQTVDALTSAKHTAPLDARLAIDERIAMLYLAAYRWDEAIAHAEENLFGAVPPESGSPASLRRALGIAPPVWVELLGAYGYKGDLDQAARMLARLEDVCAGRDDAAIWLHRGRMIFLALAGRVAAVEQLVEPRRSRHMSRAARMYWVAVAHERKGDRPAAETAYTKARAQSRGRPRVLIDRALERLPNIREIELGPAAAELVKQVEAAPPPEVVLRTRPRGPWATRVLAGGVLATAAAIGLTLGETSDFGVLMRAGAIVRGYVHAGEWWRLVSGMFVHISGLHLLINGIGLWFIGRLCEDLFGGARTIAIFAIAGVGGNVASYLASAAGISAGASCAILGLLGAVFVELTWQRSHHRAAWSRALWTTLSLIAFGQIGINLLYAGIADQVAHVAGLVIGLGLGFVMSPSVRWAAASKWLARVVAIAFAAACALSAVLVVRTSTAASLGTPTNTFDIARPDGVLTARAPANWVVKGGELIDPDDIVNVLLDLRAGPLAATFDTWTKEEQKRAHDLRFDQIDVATEHLVPLPDGWQSSELVISMAATDPLGGRDRYRVVVAAKQVGDATLLASIYVPETMARDAPAFFTQVLASVK
jgi:rhomboid protease GluP